MPDNVGYTPGVGATIAADDIGGVLYQRVKMIHGAEGIAHETADNNPMPIKAMGELIEAIEAMRMAIQSLNRSIGMAQVNPLTGSMFVDGSRVNQPISGNLSTVNQLSLLLNAQAISGQITVPISMERCAADNLRRNIITT